MIRVLLVISNLEYGGAQRQVVELANHLDPERFTTHVCSLSDYVPLAASLLDATGRLHIVQKRAKFDVTVIPRLAGLLRTLHTDLVHSFLFDADIATRLAGRLARTRAIVGSERNTNYSLKRRQLIAYRLTHAQVDLIVANSHAGAAFSGRLLGYPASMYRVVHNGVNVDRFAPGSALPIRRQLGLGEDDPVVGMFASLKAQKNHPLLFAAAPHILAHFPRVRFLLVGDMLHRGMHGSDSYARRVHQIVDDLGLRPHCVFLGNRQDVAALYRACDVTVLPSLFEGTPNAVLESMACGVPVVATDVSDNATIVPDGQVGYVVPLHDSRTLAERICRLLASSSHRRDLGLAARAWVARTFSAAALGRQTGQIYQDLLDGLAARRHAA